MGIALLQSLFRYHEEIYFLERSQARCCSSSFLTSKVDYLLNSSSTEEPFPPMCTMRHSKAYADPSRKKDRSSLRKMWILFMITHVHPCPASHTGNGPSLNRSSLTISPTVLIYRPMIFMCLVS